MRSKIVNAGQTELILNDVFQLLMERHELLLVAELVRQVEPEPGLELVLVTLVAHLLSLRVHAQVEEAASQIDVGILNYIEFGNIDAMRAKLIQICYRY